MEKIKIDKLEVIVNGLQALAKQPLPAVEAFRLGKFLLMKEPEVFAFVKAKRSLFEKYGEKDGDNLMVSQEAEGYDEFMEEMTKLCAEEVVVELPRIKLSSLGADVKLSAEQMVAIDEVIVDE